MDTLTFDIVTPQATIFSGSVQLVEAPGAQGDFGVLAGHSPFVSTLRPGVVTVHGASGQKRLFVAGGIAEANAQSCTILAEQVVDLDSTTRAQAEERVTKAKQGVENAFEDDAKIIAAHELEVAEALLAVMG